MNCSNRSQCHDRNIASLAIFIVILSLVQGQGNSDTIGSDVPQDDFVQFIDVSFSPNIFQTDKLPTRNGEFLKRYMATIGNGHIATTVYTDTVFMNGVYNGFKGESHRAKIPSRNNIRFKPLGPDALTLNQTFSLDVSKGVFIESFLTSGYQVEHRIFAHRFYHTVIVNQVVVIPLHVDENSTELVLQLQREEMLTSPDFDLEPEIKYESIHDAITQCGRTKEVEDSHYQPETTPLCMVSSRLPDKLTVPAENRKTNTFTFFTAYDKIMRIVSTDFDALAELVAENKHDEIYNSHTRQWAKIWERRIEVHGNLEIAKIVNGCWYYLLTSLPIVASTNSVTNEFNGVSPGGLANGEYLQDYQGHAFWDTEIWMFPAILFFHPDIAKAMLNYRLFVLQAARDRAKETGFRGARFPWESCFTGREVTPDCCPETRDYQIHVTGDVAFAIRQYISATRDFAWLTDPQPGYITDGMGMLKDIAEFWISRTTYDPVANQHDILHVMPPDEDHHDVDNSVYTNVIAAYAVFFAKYSECLARMSKGKDKQNPSDDNGSEDQNLIPNKWVAIAKSLKLIHDPVINYHPEYAGYPVGEQIKRADVVLLGYPLMYPMDPSIRKNDLLLYGNVTRTNGPGMTWAMYTIGHLELDDLVVAEQLFHRSYKPYMREPFKIWTEAQPPTIGTVNFLTGMGGFLQEIVSGYGGMRLTPEKIIFNKPRTLPNSQGLTFHGVKYLGNILDIEIADNIITIKLIFASPKYGLRVELPNGTSVQFTATATIVLPLNSSLQQFELKASPSNCPLPVDLINQDYDFNMSLRLTADRNNCAISILLLLLLLPPF